MLRYGTATERGGPSRHLDLTKTSLSSARTLFARRPMIKPLQRLNQSINSPVIVELKAGREFRGILDGYDPHLNLVLKNAEELVQKESVRKVDLALVRGDNVVYVSP